MFQEAIAGAPVVMYSPTGTANQQWSINEQGLIVNRLSGLVLDGRDGSIDPFSVIVVNPSRSTSTQQWIITQEGLIKSNVNGLVLEILKGSKELSAPILITPIKGANGDLSQQWEFVSITDSTYVPVTKPDTRPAGGKYYYIIAKHSGKVLDVKDSSTENLAQIVQYDNGRNENQKWLLKKVEENFYHLVAKHSTKLLDVPGNSQENFVNIGQYEETGLDNQKWWLQDAGDGYFYIIAKHSGKALDVKDGSKENSVLIVQSDIAIVGTDSQKWKFQEIP